MIATLTPGRAAASPRRRQLLLTGIVLAGLALAAASPALRAQAPYPGKPIRIVVGYSAGGPTDVTARLLATQLQATLGQPVIVENKPGAGSNLASETVAAAAPDGYTLLFAAAPVTMNGFLYKGLRWDVQKSFEPVSMVLSAPAILAVSPQLPVRSVQELVALAKRQPGQLSFGSTGHGGSQHLAGELFKQRTGIDMVHVPYKGAAPAMQDLMAGHVQLVFMTSVSAVPFIQDGRVRALAVASKQRIPQLPEVPTMAEAGVPGFESDSWNGLLAPRGTPADIVARLQAEVAKAVQSKEMQDKLAPQGAVLVGGSPSAFRETISHEVSHWGRVFQTVRVKVE